MAEKRSTVEIASELTEVYPTLQIVGSLGRSAYMGTLFTEVKPSGVKRDVDMFRYGQRHGELVGPEGFALDGIFENWIQTEVNGTYLVFPHDPRVAVEVPYAEDVFEPREVKIEGSTLRVPRPEVLGAISTMMYIQRPKDRQAAFEYGTYLEAIDDSAKLDAAMMEPFNVFRDELSKRKKYQYLAKLRDVYQTNIPEQYRARLQLGEKIGWLRPKVK